MSKRRGLGRGLGALIPSDGGETAVDPSRSASVQVISVQALRPNPHQPRMAIAEDTLEELAASIKTHGLIQPLIVTKTDDGYFLIAGERRWRAAQIAGLTEVPVVVKEATPQAMLELAIIENIQRADLNPLEEAYAYQQLIDEFGLTQEKVAERVGKGRSTIANLVRLLGLPDPIQQAVSNGRISGAHARALLPLPTPEMQISVLKQILKFNYNVPQTRTLVDNLLAKKKPESKPRKQLLPELVDMIAEFETCLGTRVDIQHGVHEGKIIIHYYSDEELDTVYRFIVKKDH